MRITDRERLNWLEKQDGMGLILMMREDGQLAGDTEYARPRESD